MTLINLEISKTEPDLKEKTLDLIFNNKYITAEDKNLAWQRIKRTSYFFQ
jgi:hypothetical protein